MEKEIKEPFIFRLFGEEYYRYNEDMEHILRENDPDVVEHRLDSEENLLTYKDRLHEMIREDLEDKGFTANQIADILARTVDEHTAYQATAYLLSLEKDFDSKEDMAGFLRKKGLAQVAVDETIDGLYQEYETLPDYEEGKVVE